MHLYACTHTHTMHIFEHAHAHTPLRDAHTHLHMLTHTCTHTHTCIHAHTHAYTTQKKNTLLTLKLSADPTSTMKRSMESRERRTMRYLMSSGEGQGKGQSGSTRHWSWGRMCWHRMNGEVRTSWFSGLSTSITNVWMNSAIFCSCSNQADKEVKDCTSHWRAVMHGMTTCARAGC